MCICRKYFREFTYRRTDIGSKMLFPSWSVQLFPFGANGLNSLMACLSMYYCSSFEFGRTFPASAFYTTTGHSFKDPYYITMHFSSSTRIPKTTRKSLHTYIPHGHKHTTTGTSTHDSRKQNSRQAFPNARVTLAREIYMLIRRCAEKFSDRTLF